MRCLKRNYCNALAFVATLSFSSSGFCGAATGGATEPTQIANNIELLMQTAEQARQTSVQMSQLTSMLQDLKSLGDLSSIESAMGLESGSLSDSIDALGSIQNLKMAVSSIQSDSEDLHDRMLEAYSIHEAAMQTYEETGLTPSELLDAAGEEDSARADFFRKQAEYAAEQIDLGIEDMENISRSADGIPSISGNVQGLQYLAGQNVMINRNLKEISLNLNRMAQIDQMARAEEAENEAQEELKEAAEEAAEAEYVEQTLKFGNEAWVDMENSASVSDYDED